VSGLDDLRLVSVHVVIRHGDRSPLHTLPNIVNKPFNCRLNPLHSNTNSSLTEFLTKMQQLGHHRVGGKYAGYSLHPDEDRCGSGSLTETGVEQHMMNGAFLREAYITKHRLFNTNDDSFGEQVSSQGFLLFILL